MVAETFSVEETRAMHAVDGKVVIITGAGKGIGKGMALHLGKGGAADRRRRVEARAPRADVRRARHARHPQPRSRAATSKSATEIESMVAQTVDRVRTRRLPHQQRADVPADGADRRGHRTRPRRLLHVRRQGHALGDASGVPAHAAARAGAASSTSHRRWASPAADGFRRVQRVEGSDPRAHAYRGARVGDRRHRRQRDRAGGGRAPRRGRRAERGRTGSSSRTARWAAKATPSSTSAASRGSCAPTAAATSPATRSWSTAARSCGRDHRGSNSPRAGFRFVVPAPTLPDDFDRQGHLNNAAIVRVFNDLRIAYVHRGSRRVVARDARVGGIRHRGA